MEVIVDSMGESSGVGGGVANFLSGYVIFRGEKFPFRGNRVWQDRRAECQPDPHRRINERLQDLNIDVENFTSQLQRKLVEGEINIVIPEGTPHPGMES